MTLNPRVHELTDPADLRVYDPPIPYTPSDRDVRHKLAKYADDTRSGLAQLDFARAHGLKPGHRMIEIGPGSFRMGRHAIPHVAAYACFETSRLALDVGWRLLDAEARERRPLMFWGGEFDFSVLPWAGDFVWAHSVFTHLPWNEIGQCLRSLRGAVAADAVFVATYLPAGDDEWRPQPYGRGSEGKKVRLSYGHKNPFHYRLDAMAYLAERTGWTVAHAEWPDHPKGQSALVFRPAGSGGIHA